MIEKEKLLELMSARVFHDLAGPIGAVNNSLEFFDEENEDIKNKALAIVKSSSSEAVLRLKFFRQSYGPLNDREVSLADVLTLVNEFYEKSKVRVICNNDDNIIISGNIAKLILNFAIIGLGSMIYGGTLEVIPQGAELIIKFDGKDLVLTEETIRLLQGELDHISLTSGNIQIYYTHMIINNANYKIYIKNKPGNAEFIIK